MSFCDCLCHRDTATTIIDTGAYTQTASSFITMQCQNCQHMSKIVRGFSVYNYNNTACANPSVNTRIDYSYLP